MSESVPEGTAGGTGEVQDPSGGSATEDQEAEEQLHGIMQEEDPEELKRQLSHWRSTAQRHERAARTNSGAAKRLQELEDASKTELQKAVDAQAFAERERDAARSQNARMLAAVAHDLDPDLIDFLGEGTDDEIDERAKRLAGIIEQSAKKLSEQTGPPNGGRAPVGTRRNRPVESMRPGAAPAGSQPDTPDEMLRNLLGRGNRS